MKWEGATQTELERSCEWIIANLVLPHMPGLPPPHREYRPVTHRRYLLDLAWPDLHLGIEVQGGVWQRGPSGHKRAGQVRDMHKLNTLQIAGWMVLQFSPDMLRQDPQGVADTICEAIRAVAPHTRYTAH